MKQRNDLLNYLDSIGVDQTTYGHEPVFTVAESEYLKKEIPGAHTKNLFLKDDKKQLWLISAVQDTIINLRALSKVLPAKNLRFAQADLLREHLGVEPGSVTWFALINDQGKQVKAILDKSLFDYELVGFHPLKNNATTVVQPQDLITFVESLDHEYLIFDFKEL